ncbi:unnamed protein product [Dicrocoelium dendriticum]|nr:unnamed protein product [Dicrocoelium dendriticum]
MTRADERSTLITLRFRTSCWVDNLSMNKEGLTIQPARCLFESSENHPIGLAMERHLRSLRLCEEAEKACQQSVDRLRELYQFDVESLSPMKGDISVNMEYGMNRTTLHSECRTSAPRKALSRQDNTNDWYWEVVKTDERYIPPFYHSVKYHSGIDIQTPLCRRGLNPSATPNKLGGRPGRTKCAVCLVNYVDSAVKIPKNAKPKVTMDAPIRVTVLKLPPLFQLWQMRIRRSWYSESTRKSASSLTSAVSQQEENGDRPGYDEVTCSTDSLVRPPNPSTVLRSGHRGNDKVTSLKGDPETKSSLGRWRQLKIEDVLNNLKEIARS